MNLVFVPSMGKAMHGQVNPCCELVQARSIYYFHLLSIHGLKHDLISHSRTSRRSSYTLSNLISWTLSFLHQLLEKSWEILRIYFFFCKETSLRSSRNTSCSTMAVLNTWRPETSTFHLDEYILRSQISKAVNDVGYKSFSPGGSPAASRIKSRMPRSQGTTPQRHQRNSQTVGISDAFVPWLPLWCLLVLSNNFTPKTKRTCTCDMVRILTLYPTYPNINKSIHD